MDKATTTRRGMFGHFAGAATAAVLVKSCTGETALERYNFHLAELKKAAVELDPRVGYWRNVRLEDDDANCPFVLMGFRVTGHYSGDGVYECGTENWNGGRTKYQVQFLDYGEDGQRRFEVKTAMDRMVLPEDNFNTFIGRKLESI